MDKHPLIKKICHDEFKDFAKEQLARKGIYRQAYLLMLTLWALLFFACSGYGITLLILDNQIAYVLQIVAGIVFCFSILIIAHELLHGIAYKLVGAKKVYFGAIFSKFLFYAGSDQEKFNGKRFRFVAIFPFVIVLIAGLIVLLFLPHYFAFTLTVLFIHTIFCGGDFAVLNFMQQYDPDQIYTYDSRQKRETYFYLIT